MKRLLPILAALVLLAGGGAGVYLLLRDDGAEPGRSPAARQQSAAERALLERAGGPDGSAPVVLKRWRYRADPRSTGVSRGFAKGNFAGRNVEVPNSPNAKAHS